MYIHIKLIPLRIPQSTTNGEHYFFYCLKHFIHIYLSQKMNSLYFFFFEEQFLLLQLFSVIRMD